MSTKWFRVADVDDLPPGRVRTVAAGRRSVVLTRVGDDYGALDNRCPHQGGPLGEGSIEKGWLRCPWHGYDYDPLTGTPPPGLHRRAGALPGRGARRRRLRRGPRRGGARPHRLGRDGRDHGGVGRDPRVRHGRPLQPRVRRRHASAGGGRQPHVRRHPPRGRGVVRRERVRQAHRHGRRRASASPDRVPPTCSPASTTPRSTGRRCSRSRARCPRRCSAAARSRTSTSPPRSPTSPATRRPCCPSPTTPS